MVNEVTSIGAKGAMWTLFATEATAALYDLRWMLVLMVMLIVADFWWGCSEMRVKRADAKTKAEADKYKFRFSRAGRRTFNKAVDYLTYLLLGCIIGFAITEPLDICTHVATAAIGVGVGCLFELSSIAGHVCAVHHIRFKFDLKKFVVHIVKIKSDDLADAIDESVDVSADKPKGGVVDGVKNKVRKSTNRK